MICWQKSLQVATIVLFAPAAFLGGAVAQQSDEASCSGTMTQQLRRFSEKCLADLVTFVASQPDMTAKVYSEKEKYFVSVIRADDGLLAEAVSRFNYPLIKEDTPEALKRLGWMPPENESDNWKKKIPSDQVRAGAAAQELSRALAAYGLKQGEAISLTVGPKLADKPTSG
jgi:type III secretion system-like peptide-binding chaperone